jgi:Leucine-rich repeat (LRR) protein
MVAVGEPTKRPSFSTLTVDDVRRDPNVIHARLRATNPAYRGGALVAVKDVGLVGQINDRGVIDVSGLAGMPFAALDLRQTAISNLTPLAGMPLVMLGLEGTQVTDLSPLRGMKLQKLYLNDTSVASLDALKGMPLEELMLVNTGATDLSALDGMPLKMLWLNGTPVSDIAPIAGCPLMSLTLEGTQVIDLSSLAGHPTLERLHIGNTEVTDLSALEGVKLTRLIFAPDRITKGLDIVRGMTSLEEIGSTLDGRMPPERFWKRYAGAE